MPHNSSYSNRGKVPKRAARDTSVMREVPAARDTSAARLMASDTVSVGYRPSEQTTRFNEAAARGVGIVPGTRKAEVAPIGNPFEQIAAFFKGLSKPKGKK